jgi:hypothetical protein
VADVGWVSSVDVADVRIGLVDANEDHGGVGVATLKGAVGEGDDFVDGGPGDEEVARDGRDLGHDGHRAGTVARDVTDDGIDGVGGVDDRVPVTAHVDGGER